MKRISILFTCFLFTICSFAQLHYAIVGTYKGKSAQGMAIWGDNAYLFNDGGHCRVLNLMSGKVQREFDLASAGKNTHVNAACFGSEFSNGNGPLIYISEYNSPSRCFVECVGDTGSSLVQTIQAQDNMKNRFVQAWAIDTKRQYLYAIARKAPQKGMTRNINVEIVQYRLPSLTEGANVILTDEQILSVFEVPFHNGVQGAKIKGKYLYIVTGLQEASRGEINAERAIQVVNLKQQKLVTSIDLTYVTTNEPEDIDFYKGKCLLYCGQNGGIYQINVK
ncbi:MAG: hypothetical protein J6T00_00915 [Bacteroidaceae bacterium]|nr:hypothetical protein [Bacteroidaceae bacterium]